MDSLSQFGLLETEPSCAMVISPQQELRRSVVEALTGRTRIVDCSDSAVYPGPDVVLQS